MRLLAWISMITTFGSFLLIQVQGKVVESKPDNSSSIPPVLSNSTMANKEMQEIIVPLLPDLDTSEDDAFRNNYNSVHSHKPSYGHHTSNKKPATFIQTSQCAPCVCECPTYQRPIQHHRDQTNCGSYAYFSECVKSCSDRCPDSNCVENLGCSPGCTCYEGYVSDYRGRCVPQYQFCSDHNKYGHVGGGSHHYHHQDVYAGARKEIHSEPGTTILDPENEGKIVVEMEISN